MTEESFNIAAQGKTSSETYKHWTEYFDGDGEEALRQKEDFCSAVGQAACVFFTPKLLKELYFLPSQPINEWAKMIPNPCFLDLIVSVVESETNPEDFPQNMRQSPLTLNQFLDSPIPVRLQDELGQTLLHHPISHNALSHFLPGPGHSQYFDKKDINARSNYGRTPLFDALLGPKQDAGVVKLLLENGADPNAEWNGKTPLLAWAMDRDQFDWIPIGNEMGEILANHPDLDWTHPQNLEALDFVEKKHQEYINSPEKDENGRPYEYQRDAEYSKVVLKILRDAKYAADTRKAVLSAGTGPTQAPN